jgi:hypothetical protein
VEQTITDDSDGLTPAGFAVGDGPLVDVWVFDEPDLDPDDEEDPPHPARSSAAATMPVISQRTMRRRLPVEAPGTAAGSLSGGSIDLC